MCEDGYTPIMTVEWTQQEILCTENINMTNNLMQWKLNSNSMIHTKLYATEVGGGSRGKSQVTSGHFQLQPADVGQEGRDCLLLWRRDEEGWGSWSKTHLCQKDISSQNRGNFLQKPTNTPCPPSSKEECGLPFCSYMDAVHMELQFEAIGTPTSAEDLCSAVFFPGD